MNVIWANRLIARIKVWAQVPQSRKPGVKAVLKERVEDGEITPQRYQEIVGEPYDD